MNCPNCTERQLFPVLTRQGAEVDCCDTCQGVWLEQGEIFHFTDNAKLVARKLNKGIKNKVPVPKKSPRAGKEMFEFTYPGGARIDFCASTGGLWIDAEELKNLSQTEKSFRLDVDKETLTREKAVHKGTVRARLMSLPNLFISSTITLVGLYALLGGVIIIGAQYIGLGPGLAFAIATAIILLQFILGPSLMDKVLSFFYKIEWLDEEASKLPDDLYHFIQSLCKEKEMNFPRIGILKDGAPQTFSYGHVPDNARIVISQGVLEILSSDEARAVLAHEMGHALHWDMFLMTVAQLVPLVLCNIYLRLIRVKTKGIRERDAGLKAFIAVLVFVPYVIAEYIVLWFSRAREYHADRFAGEITKEPAHLASALVKIAYGLAGRRKGEEQVKKERTFNIDAIGALGIFEKRAANVFAVTSYSEHDVRTGNISIDSVKGAIRLDEWSPWSRWFELNSTHPLIGNRLRYLSDQAAYMGKSPSIVYDEPRHESYWEGFFTGVLIHVLPLISIILPMLVYVVFAFMGMWSLDGRFFVSVMPLLLGVALFVRMRYMYREDYFPRANVSSLLKRVKVSPVRPVPCTLKGKVLGRGMPGYIFSENFVMKDATGILFLDYRRPFSIWEFLFGLLRSGKYNGQEATVEGWYRRTPVPFVEVRKLSWKGMVKKSGVHFMNKLTAGMLILGGLVWTGMIIAGKFMK